MQDHPSAPASLFNADKDPHRMVGDTTDEDANLPGQSRRLQSPGVPPSQPSLPLPAQRTP